MSRSHLGYLLELLPRTEATKRHIRPEVYRPTEGSWAHPNLSQRGLAPHTLHNVEHSEQHVVASVGPEWSGLVSARNNVLHTHTPAARRMAVS
eukprot:741489-Amphidinium_carterae.1